MPRMPKPEKLSAEILAPIPAAILDQIVRDGPLTAEEIDTASRRFKNALIERALGGEVTHHLGYPPGAAKPALTTNHRGGLRGSTTRSSRCMPAGSPWARSRRFSRRATR